ncbi:MAG TPA: hypothetical protein VMV07_02865 [Streptosporangiaceae bacterium]|nr:hypothetical protein [Streptosporangiaceae bacterium]
MKAETARDREYPENASEPELASSASSASSAFRGPGLLARTVPFAVVVALAEASLALPPGWSSAAAAVVSLVLLLAVPAALALPWARMPSWTTVLVPLAYTGSVLALLLAAGPTSGAGVVLLIPLVWTALFHRRWESACIVVAVVVVQVIVSLVPTAVADVVLVRRVLLWGALGALISIATHGLRDRIGRAQRERARLERRLRELTVLEDRERIAGDLQDLVVRRLFTAGLSLEGAASLANNTRMAGRIESAVQDLDEAVKLIRQSIFGLARRPSGEHRLRQEIVQLCGELAPGGGPGTAFSFRGPVDSVLGGEAGRQLLAILRDALTAIGQRGRPTHVGVTVGDEVCLTIIGTRTRGQPPTVNGYDHELDGLSAGCRQLGATLHIQDVPDGTRYSWQFPAR